MKAADSIRQDTTASEFESMIKDIGISEPVENQRVDEGLIYLPRIKEDEEKVKAHKINLQKLDDDICNFEKSSGKIKDKVPENELYNYLIGARLHVSSGRCTKGLNAMLLRADFDETKEILILDSEDMGIFETERNPILEFIFPANSE